MQTFNKIGLGLIQTFNQIILTKAIIIKATKIMREILISKDLTIQTKWINLAIIILFSKTNPSLTNKDFSLIPSTINKTAIHSITIGQINFPLVLITHHHLITAITIIGFKLINLARVILDSKHNPLIQTRMIKDLYFFKKNRIMHIKIYFLLAFNFNTKSKK